MTEIDERDVERFVQTIGSAQAEIGKFIVGQKQVVQQVLVSLFAGGHALLEGVPGLGKTAIVRTLGQVLDLTFSRVQFTPDLMPADIVGTNIIAETANGRGFEFQAGPVFANIVLADEINRATPKTQSALLEAMQERQVTVGTRSMKLPGPFLVLATQNPIEMEGTYPLPEAQLDRFLFKILMPYPTQEDLHQIVERTTGTEEAQLSTIATARDVVGLIMVGRATPVARAVTDYAIRLVMAAHPGHAEASPMCRKYVKYGPGPRAVQALISTAKVLALIEGRLNVAFEDIAYVAYPALRHRILLGFEGQAEGIATDAIIKELLEHVPTSGKATN